MDINIEELYVGVLSSSSIPQYAKAWRKYEAFAAKHKMEVCDPETLRAYRTWYIEKTRYKISTVNKNIAIVRAIFGMLHDHGVIEPYTAYLFSKVRNASARGMPKRGRKVYQKITPKEMRAMIGHTKADLKDPMCNMERAALLVLASSGMRLSELCHIKMDDVVMTPKGPSIENIESKAKDRVRKVPISEEAFEAIRDWLHVRPVQSDYVFISAPSEFGYLLWNKKPVNRSWMHRMIKKYATMIGRDDISAHHFRRFVATQLIEKKDVRAAQKVLGHAHISTTITHYAQDDVPMGITEGLF